MDNKIRNKKMTEEKDADSRMDETNMNSKKEKEGKEDETEKVRREKLAELYLKYGELITQVAVRRVRDYHYAQDICQEAFMRLFYKMDVFMGDEMVKAWLIVVADNISKDTLKKGGRYSQENAEEVETSEEATEAAGAEDYINEMARKDLRSRILSHLYKVNREQYHIVLLVCCLQMSVAEAAKKMHMTYDQLSMKLHRARVWIRNNYQKEYLEIKY